ncbi:MAG TPA: hypothetical protein VKB42_16250 [Dongiaceae bacterium]|nr:hypothetical protein [Dongiaceae bacterium]
MSVEMEAAPVHRPLWRRILRRRIWENLATVIIGVGVVMLMQPVSLWLYGYSLITMLVGTVMFVIVTKFPE